MAQWHNGANHLRQGFGGQRAQWRNGTMAQTTFAKASVVKGRNGATMQWINFTCCYLFLIRLITSCFYEFCQHC
jgi:hypothetical protein